LEHAHPRFTCLS